MGSATAVCRVPFALLVSLQIKYFLSIKGKTTLNRIPLISVSYLNLQYMDIILNNFASQAYHECWVVFRSTRKLNH